MKTHRGILLLAVLLILPLMEGMAQSSPISGVINSYASVSRIHAAVNSDYDSIEVVSLPADFTAGDTVMLFCVQGSEIKLTGAEEAIGNDNFSPRNTGKYAIFIVNEIVGNILVLNVVLKGEINSMGPGEVAQVIKVKSYHAARVTSAGLTAPAWNGSTGGVVVLFARTTLELDGDINVSGLGFRGAEPTEIYNGACSSTNPTLYDSSFYQMSNVRAGKKGEGITDTRFTRLRGKARNINGGGGGNARMSGGGGGSNNKAGGKGGKESDFCTPGVDNPEGVGGYDLGRSNYYTNDNSIGGGNRIFMGGGGGAGTQIIGQSSSTGGNGGGIVVIVADSIIGNGHWIHANGSSVSDTVFGAGAGGGGGGAIVLDVSGYGEVLNLSTLGGDGGSTKHTSVTGPGGGGGGGIYWMATGDLFNAPDGVNPVRLQSNPGRHIPTASRHDAKVGTPPGRLPGLKAPLRGFIFNSVPSDFWVCSNVIPDQIFVNLPKGGSGGPYDYQWLDSSATQNYWAAVGGADDEQSLSFTGTLDETTWYKRVVIDAPSGLPPDTSLAITMHVHQAIEDNVISANDEVCEGFAPAPFVSVGTPTQGDGSYAYRWVQHEGDGIYTDAPGANASSGYNAPVLDNATENTLVMTYARIVSSGACVDTTSTPLEVTIFKSLTNNILSPAADTICVNTAPDELNGGALGGGKATDYRFRWESAPTESGTWTAVGVETADYQPGNLSATIWYRRVALSGDDDACEDNSPAVQIVNIPAITTNSIEGDEQTVCEADVPVLETGSSPGGGDGSTYTYKWEQSTNQVDWIDADASNGNTNSDYQAPAMPGTTTWYRRIVQSGGSEGVCTSTSSSKPINVLPALTNYAAVDTDVKVNCQFDNLADLEQLGAAPGGGDGSYTYKWEQSTTGEDGVWSEIAYGMDKMNYSDAMELTAMEDYLFRRITFSGPVVDGQLLVCADTSDLIEVIIHTAIGNNVIDPADSVCYGAPKDFTGTLPAGEEEESVSTSFSWKEVAGGTTLGSGKDLVDMSFTTPEAQQLIREVSIGECESTSNTLELTVMELPGAILSGDVPEACEELVELDVDLNIEGLDPDRYTTPWYVQLVDGVDSTLEAQELSADGKVIVDLYTEAVSTQYTFSLGRVSYFLEDGTECVGTDLQGAVPIDVFLTPDPTISIEDDDLQEGDAVCKNEILLKVNPDQGSGTWESNWPTHLSFDPGPNSELIKAQIDTEGSDSLAWTHIPYKIWFTSNLGVCAGSDTVSIRFFEQPAPANAGLDDTVYLSNSTYLQAEPATTGEGTWTVVSGKGTFEDEHAASTFVYELAEGERNEFRWTVVNGVCESSDDFSVITQAEVWKYEGISPNGDGYNDYLIVRGLDSPHVRFTLSIFNSLGREVRTVTQENVDEIDFDPNGMIGGIEEGVEKVVWDGRAKRSPDGPIVPAGTYYYLLQVEIDQVDHQGNILKTVKAPEIKHFIVVRD